MYGSPRGADGWTKDRQQLSVYRKLNIDRNMHIRKNSFQCAQLMILQILNI